MSLCRSLLLLSALSKSLNVLAVKPTWAIASQQILQRPSDLPSMWNIGHCHDIVWVCAGCLMEETA